MIELTFISDTHRNTEAELIGGDILVHAGDLTFKGKLQESINQLDWIMKAPYRYKIIVPGNHEKMWEIGKVNFKKLCDDRGLLYLINKNITLLGLHIYGSPVIPKRQQWMSSTSTIEEQWNQIPEDIDLLITHNPPYGILDCNNKGELLGCPLLLQKVLAIKPKIHVFGHVHEQYGSLIYKDIHFINAALMNRNYQYANTPVNLILTRNGQPRYENTNIRY